METEFEDYLLVNGQSHEGTGLDLMRNQVMRMYSNTYEYKTLKKLYGTSDAPRRKLVDDGIQADSPFSTGSGPYLQETESNESGFKGLDAPLN